MNNPLKYPFYKKNEEKDGKFKDCRPLPDKDDELPEPLIGNHPQTFGPDRYYLPDDGLVNAVNAALLLGQPLTTNLRTWNWKNPISLSFRLSTWL